MADGVDERYLAGLFGLRGRAALVTGARQGLGRGIAVALARAGAAVAVTGRDVASLAGTASELEALGGVRHVELALDVADPEAIDARVREAAAALGGRLDVVVNNAGVSIRRSAADHDADDWDAVLSTNLRGPALVARAAADVMGDDGGRIINMSSTFGRVAVADRVAYAASKAGLEQLTRALAVEWAPRGITVNAVAPGLTATETRAALMADADLVARRAAQIPLGRVGTVDDALGAVLLLAGPAGAFITGQTLVVDGGYTLGPR